MLLVNCRFNLSERAAGLDAETLSLFILRWHTCGTSRLNSEIYKFMILEIIN